MNRPRLSKAPTGWS